jgi:CRP-like cAMP-binding protein
MAGFPAEAAYLIRRGQVRVFLADEDGRETTTAVLGPGHFVGVSALLADPTHHAFVQALTPLDVWVLPAAPLRAHLARDPALLATICAAVSHRLALSAGLIGDVHLRPVDERLDAVRDRLAPCLGGEPPRLTREELARLVGARRETISRAVSRRREARR